MFYGYARVATNGQSVESHSAISRLAL